MRNNLFIGIFFLLVTFLSYHNILNNKLFYDDEELIYKNAYVADLRYFPKYFSENMVAGAGKTSNMYRPILLLSFAVDRAIWGNNPIGYHLTSILLHAANAFLVYLLILKLFRQKSVALLTAILFIIHPVQTETVAYASGRTDLLCSFFILLSLLFSLRKKHFPRHRLFYFGGPFQRNGCHFAFFTDFNIPEITRNHYCLFWYRFYLRFTSADGPEFRQHP